MWPRLLRPLRDGVEPVVVLAEAPRPVRLPRENDRGSMRGARRHNPPLVEQEGHLLAALVELALRPALHRPRARHRIHTRLDSNAAPRSVGRPGDGSASTYAYSPASEGNSGGSPSSTRSVNADPSAAKEMLPMIRAVPSASVVPLSARPARVSSAQAAVATTASAATAAPCPTCGGQRDVGTSPRPMVPRNARASTRDRRVAGEAGASRVGSRRLWRPDVQPRSAQRQTSSYS